MLFLPTEILNLALWGQCESLWVCYIIYVIYFILKNKNLIAMLLLGFSKGITLHTVFFFLTLIWLFLVKRVKLRQMLLILIGYFITIIPGLIFGAPFNEAINVFMLQMNSYQDAN